jgi:CDP-glucose 4,6-dehydratase
MTTDLQNAYRGRKVLITGHTGFKGSWLTLWLTLLGAEVRGYALPPETDPSHYALLGLDIDPAPADIRDPERLQKALEEFRPELVFHLAAQPLVRRSYEAPVETFETNVLGTVHLLEACRRTHSPRAILVVTSDKCYENREWVWGYREIDPLGGHDPYSASKGAAEIVTASYRRSFFPPEDYGSTHETLVASCRAGNVIGGGDWSEDRLLPDIVRAVGRGEEVSIRAPRAVRPWQHVLDALGGYLLLGARLLEGRKEFAGAWNFGPDDEAKTVREICVEIAALWPAARFRFARSAPSLHEAGLLRLDCSKAHALLGWRNRWDSSAAVKKSVAWYRAYLERGELLSRRQIEEWMDGTGQ